MWAVICEPPGNHKAKTCSGYTKYKIKESKHNTEESHHQKRR